MLSIAGSTFRLDYLGTSCWEPSFDQERLAVAVLRWLYYVILLPAADNDDNCHDNYIMIINDNYT